MAYTVLARKHRSRTFDEIVGQDAIATTLSNAVDSGRLHHGYLFTGTRGVGKTSAARILAKSLNCLAGDKPTSKPCGECDSCRMIADGADIDVVEIDAASNTGVDNIRELRGNTIYRPTRSRFKVYIIDEVHMLSTGAFNALLKTLEEPPSHVKFILATTEIQKVPATIQSRCQRFDFRSIESTAIGKHLQKILGDEGVKADDTVIRRVSRLARGSMRDALSILDQLLAFGSKNLDEELIEQVLPAAHDELITKLVDCLATSDPAGSLHAVEAFLGSGHTPERFCDSLIEHVRSLMLLAVCGADTDLVDAPSQVREQLSAQCKHFDAPTYVYMISMLQELRRNVRFSGAARAIIDAAVLRLALAEKFTDLQTLLSSVGGVPQPAAAQKKTPQPAAERPMTQPRPAQVQRAPSEREPTREPVAAGRGRAQSANRPARPSTHSPQKQTVDSTTGRRIMGDDGVRRTLELFDGMLAGVKPKATETPPETAPDEAALPE